MKLEKVLGLSSVLCLSAMPLAAQETNNVEQLKKQLQELQQKFQQQQEQQRQQIEALQKQLDAFLKQQAAAGTTSAPPAAAAADQLKQLNERVDQVVEAQKKVRPGEFNPSIGLVGETVFSYRTKGSDQIGSERPGGFDVFQRSIELDIAASVDPFAKAYVVFNATADSATGEATAAVEEAALQTTSLPWNLELKAGRFFGEFGRLGYIHDHELPFVNRPLALDQYMGGETKTDGLQLNWLLPTPHYVSLTVGLGDQFGDDPNNPGAFRHFNEVNYWGRLSTYFDLTPNWQLEGGVSGLWNPKAEDRGGVDALTGPGGVPLTERERRVGGLDLKLSYIPLQNNQFRSFTWGTEVLYSDNRFLFDPDGTPATGDEFNGSV